MPKSFLTTVVIIALILLVAFAYFGGLWQNKEKIHQAELAMERMRSMRDSLETVVAFRDSIEKILTLQIDMYKDEADILREHVDLLEQERKEKQLSVRRLRKKEDLQQRLRQTFPEMAESDWGITEVLNEEYNIKIEYLLIPLWFSETFIIDHQNAESYLQQKHKLLAVDSLNQSIITLQDSVIVLEKLNREAYQNGYEYAYAKYDSLTTEYIQELKRGRIDWLWPGVGILAGSAVGYVIGSNVNK